MREGVAEHPGEGDDDARPVERGDAVAQKGGGDTDDEHPAHRVQDDVRDGRSALGRGTGSVCGGGT